MTVVVELTLDAQAFPFGRAVSGDPSVTVTVEQIIPLGEGRLPFFWAKGPDLDEFERVLKGNEIVKSVEVLTRVDDSVLYYVEWDVEGETFLNGLADAGGTIVDAHGGAEWSFTVRFRDHADLTRFHQFYQEEGFPVRIDRVYSLSEMPSDTYGFGLTATQREALVRAVEGGYFSVPRETTLDDIAADLDISSQAASEHVRRGAEKVLERSLLGLDSTDPVSTETGDGGEELT